MNLAHNKNRLIFLFASIGLIALPHITHLPVELFVFFYALLSWRVIGIWKPEWLPHRWLVFVLTAGGLALLYSHQHSVLGRDAGTSLFMTALALKLLEIKSARDLYLISYLAFVVAASQFLYEQSILMAVYILFVCSVLLATLVSINSHEPNAVKALRTASLIIVQALPMAIVLFVLFPRLEAPKWLLFNEPQKAKAGLSDTMEPGSISELGLSDERVFRVKFTGALPPPAQRYWRGPVLAYTDGKKWSQIKSPRYVSRLDKVVMTGTPFEYTLLMEPQNKPWVFALDMPHVFSEPLRQNAYYQLITLNNPDQRTEYKISSYPRYNTGFINYADYQDSTQLPSEPSPKIKQLVTQLHGFDNTPEQFIKQLLNHFRHEDFHYTLTPPLMAENPIERFLFDTRAGFCSHYAAAFVYLMRVAHIPARVVTGYQGGELNKVGDFLEIRQADAHAWAEVWLDHKGWVRVDPTAAVAPERIERTVTIEQLLPGGLIRFAESDTALQATNWLKKAQQLWQNVDYNWQRLIVNYDNKNQTRFLSSFGIADLKTLVYWMIALISTITALLSWLLLYQKQQRRDPIMRIYHRYCKKLGKHGFIRATGEGAKDFANRVKQGMPEQAAHIDRITDLFIKLHYGKNASSDDFKALRLWVAHLKIPQHKR